MMANVDWDESDMTAAAGEQPWYRRAPAAYSAVEPRVEASRKMRVLVVDDNTDAAAALSLLVECWGHDVRMAYTGDQAMRVAAVFCPEAVLLDIGLPGMSGYDVAARLRAGEQQTQASCAAARAGLPLESTRARCDAGNRTAHPPRAHAVSAANDGQVHPDTTSARMPRALLVAVTGYGLPEDVVKAKAAGFDHHVVKPSDPALIESLLARHAECLAENDSNGDVGTQQRSAAVATQAAVSTDDAASAPPTARLSLVS